VVRGAALHGIEKSTLNGCIRTERSLSDYGVTQDKVEFPGLGTQHQQYVDSTTGKRMSKDQMLWIVKRGDLILPHSRQGAEAFLTFNFRDIDEKVVTIPVYKYLEDDDLLPVQLQGARYGE
jgi:hypothetical protein